MRYLACLLLLVSCIGCASQRARITERASEVAWDVNSDHANYYTFHNMGMLAAGVGVGTVLAYTPLDQTIHDTWQQDIRTSESDRFSSVFKQMGEGKYIIPGTIGIALATELMWDRDRDGPVTVVGELAERSWRSCLVAAPTVLLLQSGLGASRPGESTAGSKFQPFQDANGVSGHSFLGAVVFLNAANMTDEPLLKAACYVGSTATGWSRINDGAHYTSQVVMGWWIAYLAAEAVNETQVEKRSSVVLPIPPPGADAGLTWEYRY